MKINQNAKLIFFLTVLFVFYDMVIQIFPGVITHEVMQALHIDASGLGILSGIYFYTYLLMQIPAGLLLDRYPVRYVILIPLLITIFATGLFSQMNSFWLGCVARLLMGFGTAFAFLSVAKVSTDLFSAKQFPILIGITYIVGALGAISAQLPLALLVETFGWRNALLYFTYFGLILIFLIWLFVNYRPTETPSHVSVRTENIFVNFKFILSQAQMWFVALVSLCCWSPMVIFASLWGVPFLMQAYHFTISTAALFVSCAWIGLAVASPLLGMFSNALERRRLPIILANILGVICFSLIIFVKTPIYLLALFLFLGGAACAAQPLSYAIVKEINPSHRAAGAVAFNNLAAIVAGAIFQPLTGYLINMNWQGLKVSNVPIYAVTNYQYALVLIPILLLISALVSLFLIRETYCKSYQLYTNEKNRL